MMLMRKAILILKLICLRAMVLSIKRITIERVGPVILISLRNNRDIPWINTILCLAKMLKS